MTTPPALSSLQAAEHVGVSPSTIKNWAVRLPVPSFMDPDGTRRFPPEALAVLETVKQLRGDERSYATIRRIIEPTSGGPVPPTGPIDVMAVVRPLWNSLQNELSTSARRISRLEARVDLLASEKLALEAERDAIEVRLSRLEAGKPFKRWTLFGRVR